MTTPLLEAVQKRAINLKSVEKALAAQPDLESRDDRQCTALAIVCKSKSGAMSDSERDVALRLIELGADVNTTDKDGATPLHHAAAADGEAVVDALLAKGAKVVRDKYANTPLHYSISTHSKHTSLWSKLIAAGCGLEDKNKSGDTALHKAISSHNELAAAWFLEHGADPRAPGFKDQSPLECARELKLAKVVALLEKVT